VPDRRTAERTLPAEHVDKEGRIHATVRTVHWPLLIAEYKCDQVTTSYELTYDGFVRYTIYPI
jgi:hypothetical protein